MPNDAFCSRGQTADTLEGGTRPVHPGEILLKDFLRPLKMSGSTLARHLGVPASRINHILLEQCGITADTALRLSRYFGSDARSWLNLQCVKALPDFPCKRSLFAKIHGSVGWSSLRWGIAGSWCPIVPPAFQEKSARHEPHWAPSLADAFGPDRLEYALIGHAQQQLALHREHQHTGIEDDEGTCAAASRPR